MQLSDAGGQLASRPAPIATNAPGWANNAPPGSGAPTNTDPDWMNAVSGELETIITTVAGIALSKTDVTQLAQAIQSGLLNWAADTGAVNAYVGLLNPAPAAHAAGRRIRVLAANTNTGPATYTPAAGLAVKAIVCQNGNPLPPGIIQAGAECEIGYNGTAYVLYGPASVLLGTAAAWHELFASGKIRQGGQIDDAADTNGTIVFPIPFPTVVLPPKIWNLSDTAIDAVSFMAPGIVAAGNTVLTQATWYCTKASTGAPIAPNNYGWDVEGY